MRERRRRHGGVGDRSKDSRVKHFVPRGSEFGDHEGAGRGARRARTVREARTEAMQTLRDVRRRWGDQGAERERSAGRSRGRRATGGVVHRQHVEGNRGVVDARDDFDGTKTTRFNAMVEDVRVRT